MQFERIHQPDAELEHLIPPYFRFETLENVPQSEIKGEAVMETIEVVELRFAGDKNYAPVLPALIEVAGAEPDALQQRAHAFDQLEPGHPREDGQACGEQRDEDEGAAGEAEELREQAAEFQAEHAARLQGKGAAHAVKAQRL